FARRRREKSAAAMPVFSCAARTVSLSSSRTPMIRAARIARNCSSSAFGKPRSVKTFPEPCISSKSSSAIELLLQPLDPLANKIDLMPRGCDPGRRLLLECVDHPHGVGDTQGIDGPPSVATISDCQFHHTGPKPDQGLCIVWLPAFRNDRQRV